MPDAFPLPSENPLKSGSCLAGTPSEGSPDVSKQHAGTRPRRGGLRRGGPEEGKENVGYRAYPRFLPSRTGLWWSKRGER